MHCVRIWWRARAHSSVRLPLTPTFTVRSNRIPSARAHLPLLAAGAAWLTPSCCRGCLTSSAAALHLGFPACPAADAGGASFLAGTEPSSQQILSPAQSFWDWYLQASQLLSFYIPVRVKDNRRNKDNSLPTKETARDTNFQFDLYISDALLKYVR